MRHAKVPGKRGGDRLLFFGGWLSIRPDPVRLQGKEETPP
jgi:hypothetical protein